MTIQKSSNNILLSFLFLMIAINNIIYTFLGFDYFSFNEIPRIWNFSFLLIIVFLDFQVAKNRKSMFNQKKEYIFSICITLLNTLMLICDCLLLCLDIHKFTLILNSILFIGAISLLNYTIYIKRHHNIASFYSYSCYDCLYFIFTLLIFSVLSCVNLIQNTFQIVEPFYHEVLFLILLFLLIPIMLACPILLWKFSKNKQKFLIIYPILVLLTYSLMLIYILCFILSQHIPTTLLLVYCLNIPVIFIFIFSITHFIILHKREKTNKMQERQIVPNLKKSIPILFGILVILVLSCVHLGSKVFSYFILKYRYDLLIFSLILMVALTCNQIIQFIKLIKTHKITFLKLYPYILLIFLIVLVILYFLSLFYFLYHYFHFIYRPLDGKTQNYFFNGFKIVTILEIVLCSNTILTFLCYYLYIYFREKTLNI